MVKIREAEVWNTQRGNTNMLKTPYVTHLSRKENCRMNQKSRGKRKFESIEIISERQKKNEKLFYKVNITLKESKFKYDSS